MKRKLAGCLALATLVVACGSIAPVPIRSGDVCFRCRRVIQDERAAAEMIAGNGLVSPFRTSGCAAKYLVDHPEDRSTLYVTDYDTGKFITPQAAVFIQTVDRNTGAVDYLAYRQGPAADAAAMRWHSTPMKWADVLDKVRQENRGN